MSKEQLEAEFREEMRSSIKELRADVRSLIGFKAWLYGACAAISALISLAVAIYFK